MFSVDWSVFNEPALLDDNSWLIYILNGLGWTVSLAAASFMLALVAGILIGTASTARSCTPSPRAGSNFSATFRSSFKSFSGSSSSRNLFRR